MFEFYNSTDFEKMYTYTETDLGVTWSPEKTCFRLWAPTADSIQILLYKSGNPQAKDLLEAINMTRDIQGTWTASKEGDLNGIYYTYLVHRDAKKVEVCDPYARTTGINGHRAMIIDLNSTNPEGWDDDCDPNHDKSITDAVIYEAITGNRVSEGFEVPAPIGMDDAEHKARLAELRDFAHQAVLEFK